MNRSVKVARCALADIDSMRGKYVVEMNCQVIHDSIHSRAGWTIEYLLSLNGARCGYGSVAVAGPWKERPTFYEFYLAPELRSRAFEFFEAFLATAKPRYFEVQTNDSLSTVMAQTYGRDFAVESILFADRLKTKWRCKKATLRRVSPEKEVREAMAERAGGGEWILEIDGKEAGKGGILFHYNIPYGDIYMEIAERFRKRGLGSYLVQELKRECYQLGAIPGARCNNSNEPSRRTLQKAGFVPVGHILTGSLAGIR